LFKRHRTGLIGNTEWNAIFILVRNKKKIALVWASVCYRPCVSPTTIVGETNRSLDLGFDAKGVAPVLSGFGQRLHLMIHKKAEGPIRLSSCCLENSVKHTENGQTTNQNFRWVLNKQ